MAPSAPGQCSVQHGAGPVYVDTVEYRGAESAPVEAFGEQNYSPMRLLLLALVDGGIGAQTGRGLGQGQRAVQSPDQLRPLPLGWEPLGLRAGLGCTHLSCHGGELTPAAHFTFWAPESCNGCNFHSLPAWTQGPKT